MDENKTTEIQETEQEQHSGRYPWGETEENTSETSTNVSDTAVKVLFTLGGVAIGAVGYGIGTGAKKLYNSVLKPQYQKFKKKISDKKAAKNNDETATEGVSEAPYSEDEIQK